MRVRLTLTLDLTRRREPEPEPEQPERAPDVDHKGSFILERAGHQPIGFTADTGWRGDE